MKRLIIAATCLWLFLWGIVQADMETDWVLHDYQNPYPSVADMAADLAGNIVITGTLTIRYPHNGDTLNPYGYWHRPGGRQVKIDHDGDCYIASDDGLVIKYSTTGVELWRRQLGKYIDLGNDGYLYACAASKAGDKLKVITFKCSSDGDTTHFSGGWSRIYDILPWDGNHNPQMVAASHSGSVYIVITTPTSSPINPLLTKSVVIKYSTSGDTAQASGGWVYSDIIPDMSLPVTARCDADDNLYLLYSQVNRPDPFQPCLQNASGFQLMKISNDGNGAWGNGYIPSCVKSHTATALAVDGEGNSYVTGSIWDTDSTDWDFLTIKYDVSGSEKWNTIFNGQFGSLHSKDQAQAIDIAPDGLIWISGYSHHQDSMWNHDDQIATISYNPSNGSQQQVLYFNREWSGRDIPNDLVCDPWGNVNVAGTSCLKFTESSPCSQQSTTVIKYRSKNPTAATEIPSVSLPESFSLQQNHPNPFNNETNIQFELPHRANILIEIVNVLGQNVRTLVNQELSAGRYSANWNGRDNAGISVSSGIYLYSIKAADYQNTKKLILLK